MPQFIEILITIFLVVGLVVSFATLNFYVGIVFGLFNIYLLLLPFPKDLSYHTAILHFLVIIYILADCIEYHLKELKYD